MTNIRPNSYSTAYRKKPVVINAVQWDNSMEVYTFLYHWTPEPIVSAFHPDESLMIKTLEGWLKANKGDYIIKGVKGELYACKPDIFAMTYELADKRHDGPNRPSEAEICQRSFVCMHCEKRVVRLNDALDATSQPQEKA